MKVEILGTGCPKCRKLHEVMSQAVRAAGVQAEVLKVEDIQKIMEYPVLALPAVAVDGKVVLTGKLPTPAEAEELLKEADRG